MSAMTTIPANTQSPRRNQRPTLLNGIVSLILLCLFWFARSLKLISEFDGSAFEEATFKIQPV
jgi:hypothetical protein